MWAQFSDERSHQATLGGQYYPFDQQNIYWMFNMYQALFYVMGEQY